MRFLWQSDECAAVDENPYWRSLTDAITQYGEFNLVDRVLGTSPLRRVIAVLVLATLSLLVSYAIVAVSPDSADAPAAATPSAP
jgi:hypothetical protein